MKIRIPMFGGHLEIGMVAVTEIDLSDLGPETLAKIEASRKGEETFESTAKRLLANGMMTEA